MTTQTITDPAELPPSGLVRNVSGEARIAENRYVPDGVAFMPVDYDVWGYTQQIGVWEPADDDAEAIHAHNLAIIVWEIACAQAAVDADTPAAAAADDFSVPVLELAPKGNAGRPDWVDFVVGGGYVTSAEDVADLSRDEIRDAVRSSDVAAEITAALLGTPAPDAGDAGDTGDTPGAGAAPDTSADPAGDTPADAADKTPAGEKQEG